MSTFKYFNKISKEWIDIELSDDICIFLKRSYWREEMQERRFNARKLEFEDFIDYQQVGSIESLILEREERSLLHEAVKRLNEAERLYIYLRFYKDLKLREVANVVGVSEAQASRRLKKICGKLLQYFEELDA